MRRVTHIAGAAAWMTQKFTETSVLGRGGGDIGDTLTGSGFQVNVGADTFLKISSNLLGRKPPVLCHLPGR